MSAVVLTSENSQAFYEKRLDLEPAAAPTGEPVVESTKEPDPSAKEVDATEPQKADEGKQKVHVRFSELTEQRKAAEAKAADAEAKLGQERAARELAEKRNRELEAKIPPPKVEELGPEPKPEQFGNPQEFAKAWRDWANEQGAREEAENKVKVEREKVQTVFRERQAAFKAITPDYETVVASSPVVVSQEITDAIIDSDIGPQILHHLAKNPAIAEKWKALSRPRQVKEFGFLEKQLSEGKVEPKKAEAAVATEISRAPAPITPLRGSSAVEEPPISSDGEFHGTYAQWKAMRKAGKVK